MSDKTEIKLCTENKGVLAYSTYSVYEQKNDENSPISEKAFVLETLRRITPDTRWCGETNHDNKSVVNIHLLEEMLTYLLDELLQNSYVLEGYKGNWSLEQIAKAKQKALQRLYDIYFYDMHDSEEDKRRIK